MPTLTERNRVFDDAFRRARGRPPNFVQHSVNAIRVSIAKILSSIADPKASSSYPHFAFPRRRQWPEKRRGPMAFAPPDKFDKWNHVGYSPNSPICPTLGPWSRRPPNEAVERWTASGLSRESVLFHELPAKIRGTQNASLAPTDASVPEKEVAPTTSHSPNRWMKADRAVSMALVRPLW